MTYPQTIQYLESFIDYEKIPAYPYKESLRLERFKDFLDTIGNPQESLKCIHVAGTKGKGSTCAFIAYILRQSGYKVGLYTSPHLSDFRERIRILEQAGTQTQEHRSLRDFEGMISEDELTNLTLRLKPSIEEHNKNSKHGPLSFFEVYTALAFVYFKEKKVDFTVLETGLGGRLDATNVVFPYVCAITPISYEHTQKLGSTLKEIATEKAGIIKAQSSKLKAQSSIVICAPQEKEVIEVIKNRCREEGARVYEVNKDVFYEKTHQGVNVMGLFDEYPNLELRLLGRHQFINAAVAIGVIEALRFFDIHVAIDSIRTGLYNTVWPGRCEIISQHPLVVLDGAQNIESARVLKEAVKENFQYKKLILVLGISKDKDITGICDQFYDLADEVILTKANNPRAEEPVTLLKYFAGKDMHVTSNVAEAKRLTDSIASKGDLFLVTGSLFVVGEFRNEKLRP
jgi:dihydrofolate synthase/folylpolyglutamate synthase